MKKRILAIYAIMILFTSCQDWLTIQPETLIAKDDMFSTKAGFRDVLNGGYFSLGEAYSATGPLMRDDIEYLAAQWHVEGNGFEKQLSQHEYESDEVNTRLEGLFGPMYEILVNLNTLITELKVEEGVLEEEDKDSYFGQALAMRAFVNFDLLRLFGPVPTLVNEGKKYLPYPVESTIDFHEYLTYDEFRKRLESDMNEAELYLEKDSAKEHILYRNRFNYYAVKALQARYYLWIGDKEKAKTCADVVLERSLAEKNEYSFYLSTHANMEGKDVLFFENENIVGVSVETLSTASATNRHYVYSEYLNNEVFENDISDLRNIHWFSTSATEPGLGHQMMLKKFAKVYNPNQEKYYVNSPLIRLSEMYFILMECSSLEEANVLYRVFCLARGKNVQELSSGNDVIERIINESRREFIGEGQLFYLYKRLFLEVIPNGSRGLNTASYTLPIPSKEFFN